MLQRDAISILIRVRLTSYLASLIHLGTWSIVTMALKKKMTHLLALRAKLEFH